MGDNDAIELRHLRYFVTLADALHYGRAAEAAYVTQPTLWRAVQHLERIVDRPLVDRSDRRRVRLTPAGVAMAAGAREALAAVAATLHSARRA